ncbi:Subtilisin-like protease [Platanthera guangdongensis]|uniref:Subtilisin-like protease n=1 Tax=Platanthera guangdongensis TaxID=2320717 RepID=A0ABR2M362_9ASPA
MGKPTVTRFGGCARASGVCSIVSTGYCDTYVHQIRRETYGVMGRAETVIGIMMHRPWRLSPQRTQLPGAQPPEPDVTAPGLNIVAAWSEASSPTKLEDDHRCVKYNLMSGTSMSCPHVSAAAALLKSIYPRWTSAAIRSAIISTATVKDAQGQPITDNSGGLAGPMAYGSGHIRPSYASNPGLIYDASYIDYLLFACASGVSGITMDASFPCPERPPLPSDLNYPSVAVTVPFNGSVTVNRIVTNVGLGPARYAARVMAPPGFSVDVRPKILSFRRQGEAKKFWIRFVADSKGLAGRGLFVSGSLTWSDGTHFVRTSMVVNIA